MLWEESIMFKQIDFSDRHAVTASLTHVQHHRIVCLFYCPVSCSHIPDILSRILPSGKSLSVLLSPG